MANETLTLLVKSVTFETADIRLFDLRASDRKPLPAFTAGSHIDCHLSNGMVRSYSIANSETDHRRYLIGVAKDKKSRGGSIHMHKTLMAGDLIVTSAPKNNFPLDESEHPTILIAGGIGITPIMSMAHRLHSLGRPWQLYFATRSRTMLTVKSDSRAFSPTIIPS